MSQTFVWLFLMQRSFAAAADLKPKSALFGQIQCPRQSRQKADFSTEFCLLTSPNPARAAPKVEQKSLKLKKCSTAAPKSSPHAPKSRTKSPKIEKMFYRQLHIRLARPQK